MHIYWLMLIVMTNPIALNIFMPAMPTVVNEFNSDMSTVQLTFSLYLFTMAITQLIGGNLAEAIGRRKLLLLGLFVHLLGSFLGIISFDVVSLILARILQAVGGGLALLLVRTIIMDSHKREEAASLLGYVAVAIAISQTIAPTIGGYVNLYIGWQGIFYVSMGFSLISLFVTYQQLNELPKKKKATTKLTGIVKQYRELWQSKAYVGYTLSSTLPAGAYFGFASSAPYIVEHQLGGNSADYGTWFLWVSVGFFIGSLLATRLTKRIGLDNMIRLGVGLAILGTSTMLVSIGLGHLSFMSLFIPMSLLSVGRGFAQPNAQSGAVSTCESRATAVGFMGFIQLLAATLIAQLMPVLLAWGTAYVFAFLMACAVLGLYFHYYAKRAMADT